MSAVWISEFHFCDLALPSNKDQIGQNKTTNWQISTISTQFLYSTPSLTLSSKFAMARLLAVVGLVIFLSIHWGAPFLGQEPKARLPTPESPQVSNLVIANYVLAASLIFSTNTIKEATALRKQRSWQRSWWQSTLTTGSDFRADQFLQDDKWKGEVPHRHQIWYRRSARTTVTTGSLRLGDSVFCCPSLAEEWK